MNSFDQLVKHKLKAKYYIRYADDFVFMSDNKKEFVELIPIIASSLQKSLKLELHPYKLFLKTLASGVDFLGWVHFPHHRVLRTITRKRMLKKITINPTEAKLQSYLGMLRHGNTSGLTNQILNLNWLMSANSLAE